MRNLLLKIFLVNEQITPEYATLIHGTKRYFWSCVHFEEFICSYF